MLCLIKRYKLLKKRENVWNAHIILHFGNVPQSVAIDRSFIWLQFSEKIKNQEEEEEEPDKKRVTRKISSTYNVISFRRFSKSKQRKWK